MSILSLLRTSLPETPPGSRKTSLGDNHAVGPPQLPLPELATSPANDPALSAADEEVRTAGALLSSMRSAIAALAQEMSVNGAPLTNSATAVGQGRGKGKDPEVYDTNPTEDGNIENRRGVRVMDGNAVESLLQLRYGGDELDLVYGLLNLGAIPIECGVYPVSPTPVAKYDSDDHLYASESEDEGPLLSTARKTAFSTSCHGNDLQHSAHEGNAVFDLLPLLSHRTKRPRRRRRRRALDLRNGESECRRCHVVHEAVRARYVAGYRALGCERFEREDTVPVDHPRFGRCGAAAYDGRRYGAAAYDGRRYRGGMSARIPKLSRKARGRLEAARAEWGSGSRPPSTTAADASVSVTDGEAPVRPPLHAEGSTPHPSVHPSPFTGPYPPAASRFVNLTTSISSPLPTPRRLARTTNAVPPSPLIQVQNASAAAPAPAPLRRGRKPKAGTVAVGGQGGAFGTVGARRGRVMTVEQARVRGVLDRMDVLERGGERVNPWYVNGKGDWVMRRVEMGRGMRRAKGRVKG